MRANYPDMQEWVGLSEGGFVDHPDDPGGRTMRGITQRTFNAWRRSNGDATEDVRDITKAEAEAIIAINYFDRAGCDQLPSGLDYAVGDYAVNSGVSRAVKDLQRTLGGLTVDGIAGAQTFAAARECDVEDVIAKLCHRRMRFLRSLRHWPTFKNGWTRRVIGDEVGIQMGDIGVIDRAIELHQRGMSTPPSPAVVAVSRQAKGEGQPSLVRMLVELLRGLFGGRANA